MPQAGNPSTALGNLVKRRGVLSAIRQKLGLESSGRGAPQANVRAPAPLPKAPAAEEPAGDVQREARLSRVDAAFQQMGAQPQQPAQAPAEPPPAIEAQGPQPETRSLTERLTEIQATGIPLQQQFYRLAGRPPSPREMALFYSRQLLERQLGRTPTAGELTAFVTEKADSMSPSLPQAFEA